MKPSVIVWDLETVPDLAGFAAANGLVGKSDVEVREAIGEKFPFSGKHLYCSFDIFLLLLGAALSPRPTPMVMRSHLVLQRILLRATKGYRLPGGCTELHAQKADWSCTAIHRIEPVYANRHTGPSLRKLSCTRTTSVVAL
jgi:hypothetical protein